MLTSQNLTPVPDAWESMMFDIDIKTGTTCHYLILQVQKKFLVKQKHFGLELHEAKQIIMSPEIIHKIVFSEMTNSLHSMTLMGGF